MIAKKRILIVDDEAGFTRLLKLNLHHIGRYAVEVVNDPARAVAVANQFHPDIILLDVMMPSLDGGEVARRIQSSPTLQTTPIIFLTAAVKREEVNSHHGFIGGLPFLAKPVDLHEVLASIDQFSRHSG